MGKKQKYKKYGDLSGHCPYCGAKHCHTNHEKDKS